MDITFVSADDWKNSIIQKVNELLVTDMNKLISVLYRMDISEHKLSRLLKEHPGTDAAILITELMIERQLEKIKSRHAFNRRDDTLSDEEKW